MDTKGGLLEQISLDKHQPLSISELNLKAACRLEALGQVWVEGEISNFVIPGSGYAYFSLKDQSSQVRCAHFKKMNLSSLKLTNGIQIIVRATISIYKPRGDYQLIVDTIELKGEGLLQKLYQELVVKLEARGWFNPERKRPLPYLPKIIGIVTSSKGAAVRDILSILAKRCPLIEVLIYPSIVQGETAGAEIAAAIKLANEHNKADVLIVGRGGGSKEDLWAFNEEIVAQAIFNSKIPTVSAVGHEVDNSISDLVADARAATPSAAATMLSPAEGELGQIIKELRAMAISHINRQLFEARQTVDWLAKVLFSPCAKINQQLEIASLLQEKLGLNIKRQLGQALDLIASLKERLFNAWQRQLSYKTQLLERFASQIQALSPLQTLERGYSVVMHQGQTLKSIKQVSKGDKMTVKVLDGSINCLVESLT